QRLRMLCRFSGLLFVVGVIGPLAGCDDAGTVSQASHRVSAPAIPPAARWDSDQPPDDEAPSSIAWRLESIADIDGGIAVFESVFWEPGDTESLRALIRQSRIAEGKTVLEIGTGSGLIALCCLKAGATRVVATDINPAAVANARYNARRLGVADRLDVRRVPLDDAGAYSVIEPSEQFDLIISNPPWEFRVDPPRRIADYALFDPRFELMRTMLHGHQVHLRPGGKLLLAYGCASAIRAVQQTATQQGLTTNILDDRDLRQLPELFLPGMLLEVAPSARTTPTGSRGPPPGR
ncbi:MAG: 50S ribosomal protein L11 methyltransferase, partial [Planctomycetaceae bacterium]